ncbi:aminopeptidase [Pseudomonas sp. NPDC096917]|uniref:aminopeptidase n=1 Tax=Pseudomonas sp. NPDC096917 TaxID=3364483 RepID=UPI00383B107C
MPLMTRCLLTLLMLALLNGCSSARYYSQLATGQLQLLQAREPVAKVMADPQRDPVLREHLAKSQAARTFASQHLLLPENPSYRRYADLKRPYVVWNVFATPEFSLNPVTYCFPVAGCVAYRGYYAQGGARGDAALKREQGLDVFVSGVEAYSTLGWFDDPILNSMLHWGDERLATLIFHELAHQRFYVKDDSEFNESFASFVEQEGTRQWRAYQGLPPASVDGLVQRDQFIALVLNTRQRLQQLYAQPLVATQMRQRKAAEFDRMRREYRELRDQQWAGNNRYDAWVNSPINNAKLLPFGLYDQWVPAFAALFKDSNGDWAVFYTHVECLGKLAPPLRKAALQEWADRALKA